MTTRTRRPWLYYFDEDKHQIARERFGNRSDDKIVRQIRDAAYRHRVRVKVSISEKWIWIQAVGRKVRQ